MQLLDDYHYQNGTIIARDTGAEIPINGQLMTEVASMASFIWLVNALKATRLVRGREPRARISFFPKKPRSYYAIWPVCQMADIKIVDDPEQADLHFYF